MSNSAEKGRRVDQTRTTQRRFAGTEFLHFNNALLKIEIYLLLQLLMCFELFSLCREILGIKTEMSFQDF